VPCSVTSAPGTRIGAHPAVRAASAITVTVQSPGLIAGVIAGGLVGALNGLVIAKFRINALIATLATMQIVRGLGFIISGGKAVGVTETRFFAIGISSLCGIPTPVVITLACFILFGFLLSSTTFDNQLEVARQVASDNPHLYFEIQSLNDYGTESLTGLADAVERLRSVVRTGDENGFVALMENGKAYLESKRSERI